jgi:CubicO group peptidase (beta-lactamase class C family)
MIRLYVRTMSYGGNLKIERTKETLTYEKNNEWFVETGFEPLVDLFVKQANDNPSGGRSLAIYREGKLVLDVWGGEAKPGKAWTSDTISTVFSCTKGIISIIIAQLVSHGLLDPKKPVATYWPEFAQGGKQNVTVETLLQHRAGLSAPRRDLTYAELLDGHTVVDELAKQEPLWEPGSAFGYHALTFGHLVSKLIQCVTGLTANEYLQKHITNPLDVDMWIGLPNSELDRLASLVSDGNFKSANPEKGSDQYWVEKAMNFGGALPADPTAAGGFNDPVTLAVELAGAGGVTNARGLAKIYSAAVFETDGVRLADDETLEAASKPASTGENVWHEPGPYPAWGNGFMLPISEHFVTPGLKGFGHNGLGGQAGWGSLDARIGFGYTTSYLRSDNETQKHQQDLVRALNQII